MQPCAPAWLGVLSRPRTRRAAALLGLALAFGRPAVAQDAVPPPVSEDTDSGPDPALGPQLLPDSSIAKAAAARDAGQLVTGRRLAEQAVVDDPKSVRARALLGWFLVEGEGDLSRARWHLEHAASLFDRGEGTEGPQAWKIDADVIDQLISVTGAMDDRVAQLVWLDTFHERYTPPRWASYGWPLLKLGRFDEAREKIDAALESEDPWEHTHAINARCAVEGQIGDRAAFLDACEAELVSELVNGYDPATGASNLVGARLANLRFDGLDDVAKQGTVGSGEEAANPWLQMMGLSLSAGRGEQAVDRARNMQRWRLKLPPSMRDQNRAELDTALARLLLLAGESDKGMEVVDCAIEFPDRLGYSSGQTDQLLGSTTVLRLAMRTEQRERDAERAPDESWLWRSWRWVRQWLPDLPTLRDRAVVRGVLQSPQRARGLFRVYLFNGLADVPPWLLGDVIDAVGTGVAQASLDAARAADATDARFTPYYDAFGAEIAWRGGDRAEALRLAGAALIGLPRDEALLRARVEAVAADAAWWSSDEARALTLWEQALRDDAGVIRRLRSAIPARVVSAGGADADALAARLRRSPRLIDSNMGFVVSVRGAGGTLESCLLTSTGSRVTCASVGDGPKSGERIARAAEAFHRRVFAMPLGVGTIDWNSLDGTTTVANEAAADRVDALLEGLGTTR